MDVVIGGVLFANALAWRWPRVSRVAFGVSFGVATPILTVVLFWGISLGVGGVVR